MTILLLHAFPLDSRMWDEHRAALEAAGHPVIAPNLPGAEPKVGFAAWAEQVLGLVEGELIPVGVSMGGYLSFELWRQAPDRIRALALVDTRAAPETRESREGRAEMIRLAHEEGVGAVWERMSGRLLAPGASADVVERAREIALEQTVSGIVATLETIRDRRDSRPDLPGLDVPALVVVGEDDVLTPPAEAEAMASALPHARLVRIPGAGHLPPLETPAEFRASLLAFLEDLA
jgi:pimeloyl-ACP methyl ester carboxylesterase